jgi:hypothetical protein
MRVSKQINLYLICGIALFCVTGSCCKKKQILADSTCTPNYDLYAKAYENPFLGSLDRGGALGLQYINIDKYNYKITTCNPNNNYEIAYCRKNNATQSNSNMDLYTFNFCTGQTKLLTSDVSGREDWSSNNWILYTGTDGRLRKIKSDGDSSTILTPNNDGYDGLWSPNSKKIIYNSRIIIDANGNQLDSLPTFAKYLWYDDNLLIGMEIGLNNEYLKLFSYNIITKARIELLNFPVLGLYNLYYIYNDVLYFSYTDGTYYSVPGNFSFHLKTKEKMFLGYKNLSFYQSYANHSKDIVIASLVLKDTFTNNPSTVNFRRHIAVMNPDGTDIRQVLIPE